MHYMHLPGALAVKIEAVRFFLCLLEAYLIWKPLNFLVKVLLLVKSMLLGLRTSIISFNVQVVVACGGLGQVFNREIHYFRI